MIMDDYRLATYVEIVEDSRIDLSRELVMRVSDRDAMRYRSRFSYLVKELLQELDINEHGRGIGELFGDYAQEGFWTKGLLFRAKLAPTRFESGLPQLQHGQSIGK
jgi:hypothetical protein